MAYLRQLKDSARRGVKRAAENKRPSPYQQLRLFGQDERPEREWIEVDTAGVRVENRVDFGGPWLALELIRRLKLDEFLKSVLPKGQEKVSWAVLGLRSVTPA